MISLVRLSMHGLQTRLIVVATLLFALAWSRPSRSEPSNGDQTSTRERAAAEYDRGVSAYDAGNYAGAAEAFFAADTLARSDKALANAILAAQRAHDKRLIELTARRGLEREVETPELGELARTALAEAATLPDTSAPATPAPAVAPTSPPTEAPPAPAPMRSDRDTTRTWSPVVFYAGLGATIALTAATTWSGIDALHAYHRPPKTEPERQDVVAREHRTDALLAATLVAAGATAYIGLRLVAWSDRAEVTASVTPTTASVALRGGF